MSDKSDTKEADLGIKDVLLLITSVIVLPVSLLLPFMDHSSQLEPMLTASKAACVTDATLITHNLCSTWREPPTMWLFAVASFAFLLALGLCINVYASRRPHRAGRRFANYRLATVIVVSILGFIAFTIMRSASQNHDAYNFGITTDTVEVSGNITAAGPYTLVNHASFGYGLTPVMVALLITGFIGPAFVSWHQFIYSRNYIDGQRKQK
ncbi:MAG TPA: hypothetical protein VGM08_00350, partial [Candidatus Saccharimonadales bacterium]